MKMDLYKLCVLVLAVVLQGCLGYDPEASITGLYTGPYFDPLAPRNLTAHLQDRAVLPCTVRQLGDKSVSWVRMRDADILTVDRYTFVGDERFEASYNPTTETWNLMINYVQERDAGTYECQVSTEPKMSQVFSLRVVVPRVSMLPSGDDRYVKAGSKVKIQCQIIDVVQQPDYIFWYHDGLRVLENKDSNIEVNVKNTGDESIMSTLTIFRVRRDESGNYTCMPSNLHSSSVILHVLNEEHPEAMLGGKNVSCKADQPFYLFLLFILSSALGSLLVDSTLPQHEDTSETKKITENKSEKKTIDKTENKVAPRNQKTTKTTVKSPSREEPDSERNYADNHTEEDEMIPQNPSTPVFIQYLSDALTRIIFRKKEVKTVTEKRNANPDNISMSEKSNNATTTAEIEALNKQEFFRKWVSDDRQTFFTFFGFLFHQSSHVIESLTSKLVYSNELDISIESVAKQTISQTRIDDKANITFIKNQQTSPVLDDVLTMGQSFSASADDFLRQPKVLSNKSLNSLHEYHNFVAIETR